jgi:hypothetical protein
MQNVTPLIALGFSSTVVDRLNQKLIRAASGCLEWQGSTIAFGHGHMSRGARGAGYESTHRVAWMLEHGPIPDGMNVLHRCDNPPCCDTSHLFLGTQLDNMRDMDAKGRRVSARGESHRSAKLTDSQVEELRAVADHVGNDAELGRMFGISKQHARALRLRTKRAA